MLTNPRPLKLMRDDDGVLHLLGAGTGDLPTLCGFCGENEEQIGWEEVSGVEPTCPQCRTIAAHVASLPVARKTMRGWA